jgi:NhaP-type Na+/H+ or K+/H+ antiporter
VLILIPAIVMVLLAIAAALTDSGGFSPAVADLISAVIGGIVAAVLIAIAVVKMRSMQLPPRRTVEQLRKDRQTLSEVAR